MEINLVTTAVGTAQDCEHRDLYEMRMAEAVSVIAASHRNAAWVALACPLILQLFQAHREPICWLPSTRPQLSISLICPRMSCNRTKSRRNPAGVPYRDRPFSPWQKQEQVCNLEGRLVASKLAARDIS